MKITKVKDGGIHFVTGGSLEGGCAYSAITNKEVNGYDVHWGQILVWDNKTYNFDTIFSNFHMWNTDENGVIVDDLINLEKSLNLNGFVCDPTKDWNVLVINKEDLDYQITGMLSYEQCTKRLKKLYRNSKCKVDAIYIKGMGYDTMRPGDFSKPIDQGYVDTKITSSVMSELQYS
jgi:hypothetical protein